MHLKRRGEGAGVSPPTFSSSQPRPLEIIWPPQSKFLKGCDKLEPPVQEQPSKDCAYTFAQAEEYLTEMTARKVPPAPPPPPPRVGATASPAHSHASQPPSEIDSHESPRNIVVLLARERLNDAATTLSRFS